jgi:hypothetical protein
MLKTRPKQLFGYLPLDIALPKYSLTTAVTGGVVATDTSLVQLGVKIHLHWLIGISEKR